MEFMDAVHGRRSIRKYTDQPVSREVLERVLDAACWAPSAQDLQPWYFQALTKEEDLSWVFSTLGATAFAHRKSLESRFKNHPEIVESTMEFERAMGGAPVLVLAYLNKQSYSYDVRESSVQSVAAAMQNLCLAAHNEGLGTCWFEHITTVGEQIHDRFAPDHGRLIGAVVLGYPAHTPRAPRRKPGRYEIL